MEGRHWRKWRKSPVTDVDTTGKITRIYPDRDTVPADEGESVDAVDGDAPSKKARLAPRWLLLVGLILAATLLAVSSLYLARAWLDPRASVNDLVPARPAAPVGGPPHYLFTIYGQKDLGLLKPLAVTESPSGEIYVADSGHGQVQVFDYSGNYRRSIGNPTSEVPGPGQLRYPIGVTTDQDGNLYVSDSQGGHISVFSPRGDFVRFFGETGGIKSFGVPGVITYHGKQIYLADLDKHKLIVMNTDGRVEAEIGKGKGEQIGEMQFPNGVWVDDAGLIYVSDSNNNRVQVFTPAGEVKKVLDRVPGMPLSLPRGLAVDQNGLLHVVNVINHRVQVYDSGGRAMFTYGERGDQDGQFNFPNGLWMAGKRVYITDRENNRVQVWGF